MPIYFPKMSHTPPCSLPETRKDVPMRELIAKHKVLFLDSYGVLRSRTGHYPGTERTIQEILRQRKLIGIASNTAKTSPEDIRSSWQKDGVSIPLEMIVTSGMVLGPYVKARELEGAPAIVIGNERSRQYAEQAGLKPLPPEDPMQTYRQAEAVVVCDHPIDRSVIDAAINAILARCVPAVQTTTDRFVPFFHDREEKGVSLGVMGIAYQIKGATGVEPEIIGKPAQGIFNLIAKILEDRGYGKEDALFAGDNLYEDIAGAAIAGFPSLLVESGMSGMYARGIIGGPVAEYDQTLLALGIRPTYQLPSILLTE